RRRTGKFTGVRRQRSRHGAPLLPFLRPATQMLPSRDALGTSVVRGALMLTALGALAPLLLLGEGLFRRDMAHLRIGVALLGCLVTGGALGGLLHGATARLRARGGAGAAGSWAT